MRITKSMLNILEILKDNPDAVATFLAPYMEYPTCKNPRYVMQWHIRGRSVHTDWRMEVNDHLIGWSVLDPGGIPKEVKTLEEAKKLFGKGELQKFKAENKNMGFRAETKARQPKVWLTVEGVVKPGQVGATKEKHGLFLIVDKGQVWFGAQKPYFHEYFIKSDMGILFPKDDWTRIVVRAVNVQVIDPECIAEDTLLLTQRGLVKVKDLKKSDLLIGLDGTWVQVEDIYKVEDNEQYLLKIWFGPELQVNGRHLFLVNDLPPALNAKKMNSRQRMKRLQYWNPRWKTARELKEGDVILFRVPKFKTSFTRSVEEGKLLGVFLGDGHYPEHGNVVSIAFNKLTEHEKAQKYLAIAKQLGLEAWLKDYPYNNELRLYIRGKTFFSEVVRDGAKIIPEHFLEMNSEFISGLLEGLRDADGSQRFPGFANRNLNLIGMAALLALKVGKVPFLSVHKAKDGEDYQLHWSDSTTHRKFIDYREKGFLGFRLMKKRKATPKTLYNIEVAGGVFAVPFATTHNTKKPRPGTELMWRVLIPGDQTPYALKRGRKKGWVPPKDYIPIPPDWRKGKEYEEWLEWVKQVWEGKIKPKEKEPEKECLEEMAKAEFVVHHLSWMGQVVVRGIPEQRWLLRLKVNNKVRSWMAEYDFTRFSPVALAYEGTVESKWFDFEGTIPPLTKYNPNKKIPAFMRIIDRGTCNVNIEETEDGEWIELECNGKLMKGRFVISQEEKGSTIYTIEKMHEELREAKYVLQLHEIETPEGLKAHYDIRISDGFEFNLYCDPTTLKEPGKNCKAVYKICRDINRWMNITEPRTKMMVGDLVTYVTPIESGTVNIIEYDPPLFVSMIFNGKLLNGYFVYRDLEGRGGVFERAKLPEPLTRTGDPAKGDYFKPFKVIKKEGWDYFWLEIYDLKSFSRCVDDPEKYIPELKHAPPQVLEVLVCLYPRPGKIHGARVSRVRFSDEWSVTEASNWIKKNKLHTWQGELIREKHSNILRETDVDRIVIEIPKKKEEDELERELKKKKLELIEKWLREASGG